MEITIDRLTICGNVRGSLEVFVENNEYIKRVGFAKYPYRDSIFFLDGSVLQIAEKSAANSGKIKELRYDFNPNNKNYEKVHLSVIKMFKESHFTRIDVAMDILDIDMSSWGWVDKKSRPSNIWYDGLGRKQTVYIGGKDSDLRLRIYNKAVEQKESEKVWWRVEVQMRGVVAENYRLLTKKIKGLVPYNPFNEIVPVRNGDLDDLNIKERSMILYLISNPGGFSELSGKSRTKYKKMIIEKCKCDLIDFEGEWNKKSSEVGSELESWYSFTSEMFI